MSLLEGIFQAHAARRNPEARFNTKVERPKHIDKVSEEDQDRIVEWLLFLNTIEPGHLISIDVPEDLWRGRDAPERGDEIEGFNTTEEV